MTWTAGRVASWVALLLLLAVSPSTARQVEIVLLHTSDIQGHVLSLPDWERAKQRGGLLRCATLIQRERGRSDNVLLLDCGGFQVGSPESWVSQGDLPASAAGWLRYDAMLPDADWATGSRRGQHHFGPAVYSAGDPSGRSGLRVRGMEPFRLFERDGITVAVLALDEAAMAGSGRSRRELESGSDETLRRLLRELRDRRPQVVVLLWRHAPSEEREDLQRVAALASTFPELDVILASGSWRARAEERVRQAVYSDAGSQGRYVGRVTVVFDTVRGETADVRAELLEASHQVDELDGLRQVLGGELTRAETRLGTILADNARALEGTSDWPGQSGIQHLTSLAIREAGQGDVVLYAKRARATLAPGPVRLGDLFRVAPIRDSWAALSLVAADLRGVLEENATFVGTPKFLGCHGMTYEFHEDAAPGERIQNLRLDDGEKPHGRRRLRVLVPQPFVEEEGLGRVVLRGLAEQPINRLTRLDIDTQSALVDYVENVDSLDLRPKKGMSRP